MSGADGRPVGDVVNTGDGAAGDTNGGQELEELPARVRSKFQKTKYCEFFFKRGRCRKRTRCMFAHSEAELRPLPDLRFTKMCPFVMQGETCTQEDCMYAHSPHELRPPEAECPAATQPEPQQEPQNLELAETKSTISGSFVEDDEDLSIVSPAGGGFQRQLTEDPVALRVCVMRVKNTFITIDEDECLGKDDAKEAGKPLCKLVRSKSAPPLRAPDAADPGRSPRGAEPTQGADRSPRACKALPQAPGCQASEPRRRAAGRADAAPDAPEDAAPCRGARLPRGPRPSRKPPCQPAAPGAPSLAAAKAEALGPPGGWGPAGAAGGYHEQVPQGDHAMLPRADIVGFGTAGNGLATVLEPFAPPSKYDQFLEHDPGRCYEQGWWYDGSVGPAHPAGYSSAAEFGADFQPLGWGASHGGEPFLYEAGWGAPALEPVGPVMPAVRQAAPRMQYSSPPAPSLSLLSGNRFGGPTYTWTSSGA